MNDAERLTAYRKMQDFVDRRLADTTTRMDRLRAEGKEKTATYRQLLGDKLQYQNMRWNLSRGFSAKHNVSENSVQNICRAVSPQRMRIIGSMVFFYL